ncbi:hypothetical protein MPSEU_000801700 [Mayamaea pseudoterrestris]|nr:hypothetical protein MPSEU_000801700 [Mayamaea pseudoterrestris]
MKKRDIACDFDNFELHVRLQSKHFGASKATIEENRLYFGGGKYEVKPKDIAELIIDQDAESIRIQHAKKDEIYVMSGPADAVSFAAFAEKLSYLYRKKNPQAESFLEQSSGKALGARRKHQPARPRVAFGRGARPNAMGSNTAKSELAKRIFPDRLDNSIYTKKKQQQQLDLKLDFSDDESLQSRPQQQQESSLHHTSPTIDDQQEFELGDLLGEDSDEEVSRPPTLSRTNVVTKRKHRITSKIQSDAESDDEDFLFQSHLTTPSRPDRSVTPGTKTLPKNEKGTLTSYFLAKPASSTPSKPSPRALLERNSTSTQIDTPSPSPTRYATTPRSAQIIKQSLRKNELQRSDKWLHTSPTRTSSSEKAAMALFGTKSPFSAITKDDIVSSPTKPLLSCSKRASFCSFGPSTERGRRLSHGGKEYKRFRSDSFERSRLQFRSNTNVENTNDTVKDDELVKEKPIFKFRGMYNLGNTCYMAASLQMLFTAHALLAQLRNRGGPLTQQVVQLAERVADTTDNKSVRLDGVKAEIDKLTDKFAGNLQRDAHEFISDLVESMHEELEKEVLAGKAKESHVDSAALDGMAAPIAATDDPKSSTIDSAEVLLPTDKFRMTVEVSLKCNSCNYTRSKEEFYRHVSIDVCSEETTDNADSKKASVAAGLVKFFQAEVREIKCERCTDGTHALQTMRVISRPQFLILHLKRFIWSENKITEPVTDENTENNSPKPPRIEYVLKKKKDPVSLSEKLDLDFFWAPHVDWASASKVYSLKSIVYHHGPRAESGHYSADALRVIPEGTPATDGVPSTAATPVWVGFDDTSTAMTSLDRIVSSESKQELAYMLLYGLD